MIGRLSGTLVHRDFDTVIVDVQGVGYDVSLSVRTLETLPALDEHVKLWIHTSVREDAIDLYGFSSTAERNIFRQLLNVSGVGSRTALASVSRYSPTELFQAIKSQDVKALSQISGIGKKTAQRIILDLADKIELSGAEASGAAPVVQSSTGTWGQLEAALKDLGFNGGDIGKAVQELKKDHDEDEEMQKLLKAALRLLKS
jgi:Holliday junction DNA helicase RuvA